MESPSEWFYPTKNDYTEDHLLNYTNSENYTPSVCSAALRDPLYIVIPITIIYMMILVSGVIGNIGTCVVISRNKSMHTPTNYYLYSLAISDLLLLLSGLPQEMYSIWYKYPYIFGETFCVLRGLAAETSTNATVLTITAFTVERYFAICHPFLAHKISKLSRAIKSILVIWFISLTFAIPQALQFGIIIHGGYEICTQKRVLIEHLFEISTLLFFVTPMSAITLLYILIGFKLKRSDLMKRGLPRRNSARSVQPTGSSLNRASSVYKKATSQSSRRVLKMLVAVVVAFFVCWAPFHVQRLVAIYGTVGTHTAKSPVVHTVYVVTTYVSGVLYYLSTTVNPFLYNIMSIKFREAFKEFFFRRRLRQGSNARGSGYSGTRRMARVSKNGQTNQETRLSEFPDSNVSLEKNPSVKRHTETIALHHMNQTE